MCDVQNSIGRRCCRTVGGTLQGDKDLVCVHHLAERVNHKVYEETKEHGAELARVKSVAQPELDTLTGALAYTEEQANNLIQYDQKPSVPIKEALDRYRTYCNKNFPSSRWAKNVINVILPEPEAITPRDHMSPS